MAAVAAPSVGLPDSPVDLDSLAAAAPTVAASLRTRGWCVVRFPPTVSSVLMELVSRTGDFLDTGSEEDRSAYRVGERYGFVPRTARRQAFRWLTGTIGEEALDRNLAPASVGDSLKSASGALDDLSKRLLAEVCPLLFGIEASEVGRRAGIPLLAEAGSEHSFGMLDIVDYDMSEDAPGGDLSPGTVVTDHDDPGLVSISFFQSLPGLELQDPSTGVWHAAPLASSTDAAPHIGVIWLGMAASDLSRDVGGVLPSGTHRVMRGTSSKSAGDGKRRLTAWFELCHASQVPDHIRVGGHAAAARVSSSEGVFISVVTATGKVIAIRHLKPHNTVGELFGHLEETDGLPAGTTRLRLAGRAGEPLGPSDHSSTLGDTGFVSGDKNVVHVMTRHGGGAGSAGVPDDPISIKVKMLTGKSLAIDHLTLRNTVLDMLLVLQDREGLPPEKNRALLGTPGGPVQLTDHSAMLGAAGFVTTRTNTVHLVLRLRGAGPPATEILGEESLDIAVVTLAGKTITLSHLKPRNTVGELFAHLEKTDRLPAGTTRLRLAGRAGEPLGPSDHSSTLGDTGFVSGDKNVVHVMKRHGGGAGSAGVPDDPVSIKIKMLHGRCFIIDNLTLRNTVLDLLLVLQDREGLPPEKTRALLGNPGTPPTLLNDHSATLSSVGFVTTDTNTVHLILQLRAGAS